MFMSIAATLACVFSLALGTGPLETLPEAVAAIGYATLAAGHGKSRESAAVKRPSRVRRRNKRRRRHG